MTTVADLTQLLAEHPNVLIAAGAGMSAELGLKTYWTGDENQYAGGLSRHNLTHLEHVQWSTWKNHPTVQSTYFQELQAEFNKALTHNPESHYTELLKWLEDAQKNYFVVTSNIDNAFLHYNYDPERLLEVNGTLSYSQCLTAPSKHGVFETLPNSACPKCGKDARPNALHFDDYVFNGSRRKTQENNLKRFIYNNPDILVLEFGVGGTVPSIKHITETVRLEEAGTVLQVNPDVRNTYQLKSRHPHRPSGPRIAVGATSRQFMGTVLPKLV